MGERRETYMREEDRQAETGKRRERREKKGKDKTKIEIKRDRG